MKYTCANHIRKYMKDTTACVYAHYAYHESAHTHTSHVCSTCSMCDMKAKHTHSKKHMPRTRTVCNIIQNETRTNNVLVCGVLEKVHLVCGITQNKNNTPYAPPYSNTHIHHTPHIQKKTQREETQTQRTPHHTVAPHIYVRRL